ncbi:von willebrand factor a domain-containing protein [Anaeramoeba ignava]|uniref:von willebrand factor a domain-containing protein n=1 Tax=Anaeramoeba ignava TaxID=1746090 RepID=A0A9Q0LY21_ANAIG|nr:von willebrand factor a domain-containing protein [Anaeramoeba ignava]
MVKLGLINKKTEESVPLRGVSVTANIVDFTAEVTINQRYENREKQPIETIFVFPLDPECSICGFEVFMEGKHVIGKVKEKEKAKDKYDDAIAQGHTAIKMEQEIEGVFNMSVGNIPPEKQCIVTIRYVTELIATEDKELRFFLPTTITPPFVPNEMEINDVTPLLETNYTPKVTFGLSLNLNVTMASEITNIKSQSHEISSQINKKFATVTLLSDPKESFSKDFEVLIEVSEPHQPRAIIQYEKTKNEEEKEYAALLSFYPDLSEKDVRTELIFLIDRSGSMSGSPIRSVAETLKIFLHAIPETCVFNIIGFGSRYETLFPESETYSQKSLEKAKEHGNKLRANLGGTSLLGPLKYIFSKEPKTGYARQVFLLTDGEVYNTDEIINLVRFQSSTTRVFTFGVGASASRALVSGIAEAGGGKAEFIVNNEDIRPSVMRQLNRALQPAITNVKIEWKGTKPDIVVPYRLPSIFAETRLLVYALLKNGEEVEATLRGISSEKKVEWKMKLNPKEDGIEGKSIHCLAARKMIKDLENKISQFHDENGKVITGKTEKDIDKKIIELSTKAGVMSSKTSFISVVKDLEQDSNEQDLGEMITRKISVQQTQPVFQSQFSTTSTSMAQQSLSFGAQPPSKPMPSLGGNFFGGGFNKSPPPTGYGGGRGRGISKPPPRPMVYSQQRSGPPPPPPTSIPTIPPPMGDSFSLMGPPPPPMGGGGGGPPPMIPPPQPKSTAVLPQKSYEPPQRDSLLSSINAFSKDSLKMKKKKDSSPKKSMDKSVKSRSLSRRSEKKKVEKEKDQFSDLLAFESIQKPQQAQQQQQQQLQPSLNLLSMDFEMSKKEAFSPQLKEESLMEMEMEDDAFVSHFDMKPKEPPKPTQPSGNLYKVIDLQNADGSFPLSSSFISLMGIDKKKITDNIPKDISEIIWATAIALTYFEIFFNDKSIEWKLIAKKATTWIGKNCKTMKADELKQKAKQLF